jgi:hypothetical protein
LASAKCALKKKLTRRELFVEEMDPQSCRSRASASSLKESFGRLQKKYSPLEG